MLQVIEKLIYPPFHFNVENMNLNTLYYQTKWMKFVSTEPCYEAWYVRSIEELSISHDVITAIGSSCMSTDGFMKL